MKKFGSIERKAAENVRQLLDTSEHGTCNLGEMGYSLSEELMKSSPIATTESWKELEHTMQQRGLRYTNRRPNKFVSFCMQYGKVAAVVTVVAILSVTAYFLTHNDQEVEVYAMGEGITTMEMPMAVLPALESDVLPDGTRLWMDTGSRLTAYGDWSKDSVRQAQAEGEVYFDVAHDPKRPMIIYTSRCVITVLGTKFHLRDYLYEPELSLTLYEGRVKVTGENLSYVMKPGEEVRINHQTGRLQLVDHNNEEPSEAPVGYVRGKLDETIDRQVLVSIMSKDFKGVITDTIEMRKGRFQLEMQYNTPRLVSITALRTSTNQNQLPSQATFFYLPGQDITLQGTLDSPMLVGDDFCQQQNEVFKSVHKPSREQYKELFSRHANGDKRNREKENQDYEQWLMDREQLALQFIASHPTWDASVGLLYDLRIPRIEEALSILTDSVKEGQMNSLVRVKQQALQHHKQQQRASELTQQGQLAPDFELRDRDGKLHRLSDWRGKYVILDFWASWCGPCKAGMPAMKECYKKHSGKLDIIGIATWDVEEGWHRALGNLQLPWTNVFAYKGTASDVPAKYAVKALPTKFLISPKGEILLRYEGEDEAFYEQIDRLVK